MIAFYLNVKIERCNIKSYKVKGYGEQFGTIGIAMLSNWLSKARAHANRFLKHKQCRIFTLTELCSFVWHSHTILSITIYGLTILPFRDSIKNKILIIWHSKDISAVVYFFFFINLTINHLHFWIIIWIEKNISNKVCTELFIGEFFVTPIFCYYESWWLKTTKINKNKKTQRLQNDSREFFRDVFFFSYKNRCLKVLIANLSTFKNSTSHLILTCICCCIFG